MESEQIEQIATFLKLYGQLWRMTNRQFTVSGI